MTDPGNTENPQGNQAPKPDGGKGAFGWYKPPTEPPRKLNEGNDELPQDKAPATDQETLFRAAAIKCAEMEEELGKLATHTSFKSFTDENSVANLIRFPNGNFHLYSDTEALKGIESGQLDGNVAVTFSNIIEDYGKRPGINPKYTLEIGLHTDKETEEVYAKFAQENPMRASDAISYYYFDIEGNYRKISDIPIQISPPGRKLILKTQTVGRYESEMTAGDFELAGQALQMLINRLKPQENPAE